MATREFQQWLTQMNFNLPSLPKAQPDLMLPSTELWKQDALSKISAFCSIPMHVALQHELSDELKATSFHAMSLFLAAPYNGGNHRLLAVRPTLDQKLDTCPGSGDIEPA